MLFFYFIILTLFVFILNSFFIKQKLLLSETGDVHQKFASKSKVPLTGGIVIFSSYFYLINDNIYSFILFSLLILILGILSDLKFIKSANIRFIAQIILVLSFIIFNDVQLYDLRVNFLNRLLQNDIFNYLFVLFCILIVLNGSNFIDGMNTLVIGYYLLVGLTIYFLSLNNIIQINSISIIFILFCLALVFILNLFNRLYLGDSGSYLLGFSFAFFLIDIYNSNQHISPFFIILLLWYPCYENLFSILRKKSFDRSPMGPDNNHFHQLIFFFIKKKYKSKLLAANILTAQILNFYNLVIFYIGASFVSKTDIQVILILFSVILYSFFYFKLYVYKNNYARII